MDGRVPESSGNGAHHRGPAAQEAYVGARARGGAGSVRTARVRGRARGPRVHSAVPRDRREKRRRLGATHTGGAPAIIIMDACQRARSRMFHASLFSCACMNLLV